MNKKVGILALTVLFLMAALCACGGSKKEESKEIELGSSMGDAPLIELGSEYKITQGKSSTKWASFETNNKKDRKYEMELSGSTTGLSISIQDGKGNVYAEGKGSGDGSNVYVEMEGLEAKTKYYIQFTTSNPSNLNVDCTLSIYTVDD